jgi:hypothetical protein
MKRVRPEWQLVSAFKDIHPNWQRPSFWYRQTDTVPDKERCQHIEAFFQKIAIINKG